MLHCLLISLSSGVDLVLILRWPILLMLPLPLLLLLLLLLQACSKGGARHCAAALSLPA
jgi:hypothetical protein